MIAASPAPDLEAEAVRVAALLAVVPEGLGGVVIRSPASPARAEWLAFFHRCVHGPQIRIPSRITSAELLGGLDLDATLARGRPVQAKGVVSRADGGWLIMAMAERMPVGLAAEIGALLDGGAVRCSSEDDGVNRPVRFGLVALDEGETPEESLPDVVGDRLALHITLPPAFSRALPDIDNGAIGIARSLYPRTLISRAQTEALVAASLAMGILSLRRPLQAVRVARASAALSGQCHVRDEDVALAARLVLGPRARHLPASDAETQTPPEQEDTQQETAPAAEGQTSEPRPLEDVVLEAAQAAIPADLLSLLNTSGPTRRKGPSGSAGETLVSSLRGRPLASRKGDPRRRARLDLLATLMAAAPWQTVRRRSGGAGRIVIESSDFRVRRYRERKGATTIFVVDASGSTARDRLAEAKGAIELLLADCYVRRDQVALVTFRGRVADVLLPPTRSLHRARKCLSALPGGGGTPLAAGLDAAGRVADEERRRGRTPTLVVISDGRANVARDGEGGRERAQAEAEQAASCLAARGIPAILIDNAPRPEPKARGLAHKLNAAYVPLPVARAEAVAAIVRAHSGSLHEVRP